MRLLFMLRNPAARWGRSRGYTFTQYHGTCSKSSTKQSRTFLAESIRSGLFGRVPDMRVVVIHLIGGRLLY